MNCLHFKTFQPVFLGVLFRRNGRCRGLAGIKKLIFALQIEDHHIGEQDRCCTGNEVDLEQILLWNPDVIIFAPDSCYENIASSSQWQSISAVSRGNFYKTPTGPYGWLSSPPAVQRYLGMLWLGQLLYPEYTQYDLQTEVTEYYKLFYGCELTEDNFEDLRELIDTCLSDPKYEAGRREVKAETWEHPNEGAVRAADYLIAKYEELNAGKEEND